MASMKGANKNGVSRGVFRPCGRLGQSLPETGPFTRGQTYDDSETDKDEGPGCTRRREVSRRGTQRSDSEGGGRTHIGEPLRKVPVLEFAQAAVDHDQAEDEVEPSSAVPERRDEAPQLETVRNPVRQERDRVRREDLQEDGDGHGEDSADDGARERRDLGEL